MPANNVAVNRLREIRRRFVTADHRRVNALVASAIKSAAAAEPTPWQKTVRYPAGDRMALVRANMRRFVTEGSRSRMVRDATKAILVGYGVKGKDYVAELAAIQFWIQRHIRYTRDRFELFQMPQRLLMDWVQGKAGADCDDMSMLFAAMAASIGHTEVAILLLDSKGDGMLSHAMALVRMFKPLAPFGDTWIPVELTKQDAYLGWLTPEASKLVAVSI